MRPRASCLQYACSVGDDPSVWAMAVALDAAQGRMCDMPFFKADDGRDDRDVSDALLALRKRLVKEIATEPPKMVWKITSTFQCLIRRTVEAADGMRMAWNIGNFLTAITMGRSLIETGAIVRNLADGSKERLKRAMQMPWMIRSCRLDSLRETRFF